LTTSTPRRSAPASSPRFSKYESSRTISLYHFFRVNDVAFLPWQPYTMDRSIVGNPCPSLFFLKILNLCCVFSCPVHSWVELKACNAWLYCGQIHLGGM
jgi:hypothetical protein